MIRLTPARASFRAFVLIISLAYGVMTAEPWTDPPPVPTTTEAPVTRNPAWFPGYEPDHPQAPRASPSFLCHMSCRRPVRIRNGDRAGTIKQHVVEYHYADPCHINDQGPSALPFRCTRCEEAFGTYRQFARHDSSGHEKKGPYVCEDCDGRRFISAQELRNHAIGKHAFPRLMHQEPHPSREELEAEARRPLVQQGSRP